MKITNPQLKVLLLEANLLTNEQIEAAEKEAKAKKIPILEYLPQAGFISDIYLGQLVANHIKASFVNLRQQRIDETTLSLIPESMASSNEMIAFSSDKHIVKLAMTDPGKKELIHKIEKRTDKQVEAYYATKMDIKEALTNYKCSIKDEMEVVLKKLSNQSLSREERDNITVEMVDILLTYGYQNKASDIHIEPYTNKIVVRLRIDGVMHDVLEIPKELSSFIISRIKILAKMRTDEHLAAQDGKLRFKTDEGNIDVRISAVPVTEGENIVMRLLSSVGRQFDLPTLGLLSHDLKKVEKAIKDPHGMILVTGPTGSGKTTTLYAVMKILNKREVHISTIEDPVEYDIEGVSQIQVNPRTNLTFAKGLRALVRQDPDIIMVGEIRDKETAGIAVNSAMTGHLVLSTLHTNDAATTLPRLLDMGIEPFLVASTVEVIIAQRLVRKICLKCRSSVKLEKEQQASLEHEPRIAELLKGGTKKDLDKVRLYHGNGCKVCAQTGYTGRVGIFEVMVMNEDIKKLIIDRASSSAIIQVARKNGMTTMLEDGVEKVLSGITTLDEVLRVTKD